MTKDTHILLDPDTWLWRKDYTLQLSMSADECLSIIQNLDRATLNNLRVATHLIDRTEDEEARSFIIESRSGRIKGYLIGHVRSEQDRVMIAGAAGISPEVIFFLFFALVGISIIFLATPARDLGVLFFACGLGLLFIGAIYLSSIMTRTMLLDGLIWQLGAVEIDDVGEETSAY